MAADKALKARSAVAETRRTRLRVIEGQRPA